jgi:hypothetical protein
MKSVKSIVYRGGIAKFHLPSTWIEEYEPAGGGTFYEDKADAGTLRINVMEFNKPPNDPTDTAYDFLSKIGNANAIKELRKGLAISCLKKREAENGKKLLLYIWQIGVHVTPLHFRLIAFTYTILAEHEFNDNVQQEIAMLDKSISEGEYSATRGVPGKY